jgi:hypothetical protein
MAVTTAVISTAIRAHGLGGGSDGHTSMPPPMSACHRGRWRIVFAYPRHRPHAQADAIRPGRLRSFSIASRAKRPVLVRG